MSAQRSLPFHKIHIALSLASAGIISSICDARLILPVGIGAFHTAGRRICLPSDREYRVDGTLLKRYTGFKKTASSAEGLLFTNRTCKKKSHVPVPMSLVQTKDAMTVAGNLPGWAQKAFKIQHDAYEKIREAFIPELGVAAVIYKHKITGISIISLATDASSGKEICFDIIIPTPPSNDCGCPHILEHAVLEGSKKYPNKGGFSILLQGGFQSFVNAFTYKDRTSYLFASTNEKDFYITADFYMSAVFQPNVRHDPRIFRQEAWHYKVSKHDPVAHSDEDHGIILHDRHISYGGIVYSEMKKAYSDPLSRAQDYIYQGLYTNSYRFDSGGDPEHIVRLNHKELVDFYVTYYGPKTANIYFYGPDDVLKRLNFVDNFLKESKIIYKSDLHTATIDTANSQLYSEFYKELNGVIHGTFGATGCEGEDLLLTGWLLDPHDNSNANDTTKGRFEIDSVDALGMEVLEHLLVGTSESFLYKSLIKSGLGNKVVGSGLTNYFKQSSFVIGLAGVNCEKFNSKENARLTFEEVVMSTFQKIVNDGIKKEALNASLNYIEFQMRELNTGSFPKGLMLVNLMQSQSQYGKDPFAPLFFDSIINELKERLMKDPLYFPKLVERHFLQNKHKVTVHMEAINPNEFEKISNESTRHMLFKALGRLSRKEVDHMEGEYSRFKSECEEPEDRKISDNLPTLSLNDIERENELIPTTYYVLGSSLTYVEKPPMAPGNIMVLCHPIETQGIIYLDLAISLEDLTLDEIRYMDIFCSMLKEAGTYVISSEDLSYRISANLGGFAATFAFMPPANGRKHSKRQGALGYLYVRSKALKGKENDMIDIIVDVLKASNFGNMKKGLEIIRRKINQMETDLISEGHKFASRRLMKGFSVTDYATEVSSGYEYLQTLKKEIHPTAETDWSRVETKLENIRLKLLQSKNLIVNVTASADISKQWLEQDSGNLSRQLRSIFVSPHHVEPQKSWAAEIVENGDDCSHNEVIVAPTKVNFVGMGGPLFNEEPISGADDLVLHYLTSSYLWRQVRMSLGAYGVFCNLSTCGDIVFMSYADPNFNETLQVFKNVPNAIEEVLRTLEDKELLRQKIGKISSIDKPLSADSRGFLALNRVIRGETDADRQLYREDILDASVDCFTRLYGKMRSTNEWHKVCAVVSRTTAETLPKTFIQLNLTK
ncbi:peptidase M16 inactive domain containing protein, putative [Babesia bigemina]|uniref:Peptidase M16 inactive domain containing protein, putative n=1 Tax=Babesia bigemina TaxID=5866 RepID=A0A061D8Z5_BABBI|nr:peptidase M16 inactive domain containing protein, putative [Babesia bigemina]CDR95354.1 peptidase M16 inactive domain containing protein, putative [Babesia bigemina]|eukprot:XP_012767540.1 peptidase M16 inactive domain containing protein, putative [Babesia bigemina]